MKYFLKQMILGKTVALPLEETQYEMLKISRDILMSAKAIEEKYDLMISNFFEFEKEILTQIAQGMVFNQNSYDDSYNIVSTLNRRVINLLTSTKLYYDQIEKHVRVCMHGDSSSGKLAKSYFSEEYDGNLEYRFMEALRNHVQHYGLAVHSLSSPIMKWIGEGENKQMVNTMKVFTMKDELSKDTTFKVKVLSETNEKTDLVKSTRVYVGSYSNVHGKIRKLIECNVTAARKNIEEAINKYKDASNGETLGVYAYSVKLDNPNDKTIEKFPVILDWDNVRLSLYKKNMTFPNISKWYVSGSFI